MASLLFPEHSSGYFFAIDPGVPCWMLHRDKETHKATVFISLSQVHMLLGGRIFYTSLCYPYCPVWLTVLNTVHSNCCINDLYAFVFRLRVLLPYNVLRNSYNLLRTSLYHPFKNLFWPGSGGACL